MNKLDLQVHTMIHTFTSKPVDQIDCEKILSGLRNIRRRFWFGIFTFFITCVFSYFHVLPNINHRSLVLRSEWAGDTDAVRILRDIEYPDRINRRTRSSVEADTLWRMNEVESPDRASPRTRSSAKNLEQLREWIDYQHELRLMASSTGNVDVLFLGDSITESLVGKAYGRNCDSGKKRRCKGISKMFDAFLKAHSFSAHVSAISGDQAQHLLWRLGEGDEMPSTLNPVAVVILIGTNNIPYHSPESIALGIEAVVDAIHNIFPHATLLVNELFPRDDNKIANVSVGAVNSINSLLQAYFSGIRGSGDIKYLQCGHLFTPTLSQLNGNPSLRVNTELLPDKLHPNMQGMKLWLESCVLPALPQV